MQGIRPIRRFSSLNQKLVTSEYRVQGCPGMWRRMLRAHDAAAMYGNASDAKACNMPPFLRPAIRCET
jgi:hypothetical protein